MIYMKFAGHRKLLNDVFIEFRKDLFIIVYSIEQQLFHRHAVYLHWMLSLKFISVLNNWLVWFIVSFGAQSIRSIQKGTIHIKNMKNLSSYFLIKDPWSLTPTNDLPSYPFPNWRMLLHMWLLSDNRYLDKLLTDNWF